MIDVFSEILFYVFLGFFLYVFYRILKSSVDLENKRNKLITEYLQILIDKEKK